MPLAVSAEWVDRRSRIRMRSGCASALSCSGPSMRSGGPAGGVLSSLLMPSTLRMQRHLCKGFFATSSLHVVRAVGTGRRCDDQGVVQVLERVRDSAADAIFARVAGPDAAATRARIHETPGPRWFAPGSPVQRVHGDASMFVGGLRALLLQSLHPLAMAGVAAHSGYRGDPWGRLQRTSTFIAVTTFGTADDAERAVDAVRAVHQRVRGRAPDGRAYRASDPDLLRWVHVAETQSFLVAHQRYGHRPLDAAGCDE